MSTDDQAAWNYRLLTAINAVQREFIVGGARQGFHRLLAELLQLTDSRYGFVGEVRTSEKGLPYLKTFAISDIAWNDETRRFYDQYEAEGMEFHNLDTLFGRVLSTGKPLLTNNPAAHPAAGGLPSGHPVMNSFGGLPLHIGGSFVGIAGLANRPDGYDQSFIDSLEPILQTAGYMIIASRDREARQSAERSASVTEKFRASLVETALDCVIAIDEESLVLEFNPAAEALFGWKRSEVLGKHLGDLIVPERLRAAHAAGMKRYLATGKGPVLGNRVEVPAVRRDGTEFPVELAITAAEVDGRSVFTAYLRDITKRKEAEEAIRRAKEEAETASRAKSTFVATISHEIRTPINAIMGALGLLETVRMDARHRAFLETAQASATALHGLVSDVLDFSRIEAGRVELEPGSVRIAELCDGILHLLKGKAHEEGTQLGLVIHRDVPEKVVLDGGKIRQVLLNIVGNAVKFTRGGHVRVDVRLVEDWIEFMVVDNGVGLDEADLELLFTEFLQFGEARTKGGTGLGLAICKRLVELMGGRISARSVRGEGSVFRFAVPFERIEGVPARPRYAGRALLAGRSDFALSVLTDQLKVVGMQAEVVENVDEALRALKGGQRYESAFVLMESARSCVDLENAMLLAQRCAAIDVPLVVVVPDEPECRECVESKVQAVAGLTLPVMQEELGDALARVFRPSSPVDSTWTGRVPALPAATPGVRVLLADDSQANRLVMAEILRRGGFDVDTVGDGAEAVEAVRQLPYDVILMDLDMPVLDGLAATRDIRHLGGAASGIPVIALTAHALEDTHEQIAEAGLTDFLTKPVERETLFEKITHWADAAGESPADPSESATIAAPATLIDLRTLEQLGKDTSPELVPKLVEVFVKELDRRRERIEVTSAAQDLQALGREAHILKSSAATYGAVELANWARTLNSACNAGDLPAAQEAAARVGQLITPTVQALNDSTGR